VTRRSKTRTAGPLTTSWSGIRCTSLHFPFSFHNVCQVSISRTSQQLPFIRGDRSSSVASRFCWSLDLSVFRYFACCSIICLLYPCFCFLYLSSLSLLLLVEQTFVSSPYACFSEASLQLAFPVTAQFISHVLFSLWSCDLVLWSLDWTCFLAHHNHLLTIAIAIAFHIVHSLERILGAFFATPSQLHPFM
jgi:hypothetical protein